MIVYDMMIHYTNFVKSLLVMLDLSGDKAPSSSQLLPRKHLLKRGQGKKTLEDWRFSGVREKKNLGTSRAPPIPMCGKSLFDIEIQA